MQDAAQKPGGGLTAAELALAAAELACAIVGARVLDIAPLVDHDDLLLVLQADGPKLLLHVALGTQRARITLTQRRFTADERAQGPKAQSLQRSLQGAVCTGLDQPMGERRLELRFAQGEQQIRLCVELFSQKGLWALCAADGAILELSRKVETAVRSLRPGQRYVPPPEPRPAVGAETPIAPATPPASRFHSPVLPAIDAHFWPLDQQRQGESHKAALGIALQRAIGRLQRKHDGIQLQLEDQDRPRRLRDEADLILAHLHAIAKGSAGFEAERFDGQGTVWIELDPALPARLQADARYERARRHEAARGVQQQRLQEAAAELSLLLAAQARLAALAPTDESGMSALAASLRRHGVAVAAPAAARKREGEGRPRSKAKSPDPFEGLRRFRSAEGYEILVGKDNKHNDRLTMRVARGNDIWLHVGGGRPGSHVVVRLPKGKTASLETLLDAGHLAVHFSKARGERTIPVVYTFAKHVRKPKGAPAGSVVPQQTKTLSVRLEDPRLQRLLDSQGPDDATGD